MGRPISPSPPCGWSRLKSGSGASGWVVVAVAAAVVGSPLLLATEDAFLATSTGYWARGMSSSHDCCFLSLSFVAGAIADAAAVAAAGASDAGLPTPVGACYRSCLAAWSRLPMRESQTKKF